MRHKSSLFGPVTAADQAAEPVISAQLLACFPGALIVGKEAVSDDPSLLDRLADAPVAFVVDPIDGTRNFVAGLPLFGVMAAAGICHLLFFNPLMPWDHAAGWLMHQEARGFSAHFDSRAYRPAHTVGRLICTPDEVSWQLAQDGLLGD